MPLDEILPIEPIPLPFELDAKIFQASDENGEPIGELYSYNDFIKKIVDISGVNPEFLGKGD